MKETAGSWQTERERKKVSPYLLQALANRGISEQGSFACLRPFPVLVKAVVLIKAPMMSQQGSGEQREVLPMIEALRWKAVRRAVERTMAGFGDALHLMPLSN